MNKLKLTLLLLLLFAGNAAAQAMPKIFYFFPPNDNKWIAGKSYLYDGAATIPMEPVGSNMCGWYRVVYFDTEPPENIEIWLGKAGTSDKIGTNGRLETDLEEGADVGYIPLKQKFADLGDTLYFVANEGYVDGLTTTPGVGDANRCGYSLAAFIYDTDKSVNPSFTFTTDDIGAGSDQYNQWTSGIIKGMVKPTLNSDKKIECDNCTGKPGAFNTEQQFYDAFTVNNTNVQLCYDMPFTQASNGNYEFDSDVLLNHQGKTVGGFFPEILNNTTMGDAAGDYSNCPSCRTLNKAESFVGLTDKINPWCFERGFKTVNPKGEGMANCGAAYGITQGAIATGLGDFAHGGYPADTWGATPTGNAEWRATWRDSTINLWGGANSGKDAMANQHFCFESHANFIYDPEQEFFFRGDDDIWVYINNQLVIDLGGSHLAAPGYVKLADMTPALEAGKEYPIDIFFCDRRTTMSNVRISTNMYVTQKSSVYTDPDAEDQRICISTTSGDDCAAKMGLGGGSAVLCGPAIATDPNYDVEYFMVRRGSTDTLWLDPNRNTDCLGDGSDFRCYGGLRVFDGGGSYSCGGYGECRGNPEAAAKVNLAGNFTVFARVLKGGVPLTSRPINIDGFKSEANTCIVWGKVINVDRPTLQEYALLDANGEETTEYQNVMAGVRTPIYFASGAWQPDGSFYYDSADVGGMPYSLREAGLSNLAKNARLKIYNSKDATEQICGGINIGSCPQTFPMSGIDTLWVEGNYEAEEYAYDINVTVPSKSAPSLKLRVTPSPSPIISQVAFGKIQAQTTSNAIILHNLPTNSKVEVYNLKGNRIYLGNTGSISTLSIGVHAKGMYIVKSSFGSEKQVVRVVVR